MSSSIGAAARTGAKQLVRAAAMSTAALRPPPDLIVIGAKRAGTTSLFRDLERHPAMCPLVPSARRLPLRENQKGVHFFDTYFTHGDRWYRSHFPTSMSRDLAARRSGAAFTAEASPYYLFHPLAAERAAQALPDAVFAVQLRDPVDRTVSHWAEQTRNGVETLSLADALAHEDERVGDDEALLRSGALPTSHAHEQQTYARQSEYANSLQRWFDLVGRDRVLVSFAEDYYADPGGVLRTITDRLGVDPMPNSTIGEHRNAAARPSTLDHDLEAQLIERFAPDVEAVAALLGTAPPWPRFMG